MPLNGSGSPSVPERSSERLHLRLYVAGDSPSTVLTRSNLQRFCEEYGCWVEVEIEVIDVLKALQFLPRDGVLVAPALVKISPKPPKLILGDLSQKVRIANALGFEYPPGQPRPLE
jgi:circadian clock protein KaiB